jgi:hypothetical protein
MKKILLLGAFLLSPLLHAAAGPVYLYDAAGNGLTSTGNKLDVAASITNPTIGAAVPATAVYVAGTLGGTLTGLKFGQQNMANSVAVNIASNQSAIPASQSGTWNVTNISGTVSLPTGAATAAKQPALGTAGTASADVITVQGIASMTALKVDGSAVVQPSSQSGTWTVQPGNTANTTAWLVNSASKTASDHVRNSYSSVNVTTSAYVQLTASLAAAATEIEVFDSGGQTMVLATGGAGVETDQIYIMPGGNGRIPLKINAGTRVSIKAVSATASTGEIDINFYN